MSDATGDTFRIVKNLYVQIDADDSTLSIECNWCTDEGSEFFQGYSSSMHSVDWLAKAVLHFVDAHPDRMKDD